MSEIASIQGALKKWREGLVGLDRRNRLIRFRAPRTGSLTFDAPDADEVLIRLRSGKPLELVGDRVDTAPEGAGPGADSVSEQQPPLRRNALHVPRPENEVGPVARNLMRRANEEFLDRGLSILYVAFGMLRWTDTDGSDMASPLLLVPVELVPEGPRATPRLRASEDDPVLNPALPLRLSEFGVQWPALEDVEELSVTEMVNLFSVVFSTAKDLKNWAVHPEVHLSTFSFSKEAMYRDLVDNEARIIDHPVVKALANTDPTSQTDEFQFDPIDPSKIDELAPPEKTPLVLDADSSQRAAVAAAVAGRSFVMDGPPGTGKSQTIANMIGALMHAGKSVLFVSEKIAALDVVKNRLEDAGLGSFLLELHSHKANRREVAIELLKTLDHVAQPPNGMSAISRAAVQERRKKLNGYALAMNEVRMPLNRSLHDVLGELAYLVHVPAAPLPERPPLDLSQEEAARLEETLAKLERNWRPAAQGNTFLWRDVIEEGTLEPRLWAARASLDELKGTLELNIDLAEVFDLHRPDRARRLAELLELQHRSRPARVNDAWVTSRDMHPFLAGRDRLVALLEEVRTREAEVIRLSGAEYDRFAAEPPHLPNADPANGDLTLRPLTGAQVRATAELLRNHQQRVSSAMQSLTGIANALGLSAPETWAEADRILRIVELRAAATGMERGWLTAAGLQSARDASSAIRQKSMALDTAEQRASTLYRSDVLGAPLRELKDRFDNLHTGLRKLSGNYRRDKRSVAALLADAKQVKSGIARLSEAIAWADAEHEFEAAGVAFSQPLGRYWNGRETDWAALEKLFGIADELTALIPEPMPQQTVAYFNTSDSDPSHVQLAATAKEALDEWKLAVTQAPVIGSRPELLVQPIQHSQEWMNRNIALLDEGTRVVDAVTTVTARDQTLDEADAILRASEAARRAADELDASSQSFSEMFPDLYQGKNTDAALLNEAVAWAERVRAFSPAGYLSDAQLAALSSCSPVDKLPLAIEKWEAALAAILDAFAPARHDELVAEFATFPDAYQLIEDLNSDTPGQQEWFDYVSIREELSARALDATVQFCIESRVPAPEVPKVIKRALLRGWADAQIKQDDRLHPLTTTDREALVDEFRKLDRQLVAAATADIIRAANANRPANVSLGEPALIRREGMKQRRHIPVRNLISQARATVQAIKPVFMMSPLAVSQYLPADMEFDVVIFDEASQVTPGDSINCIYRGRAFVLAGDDKQLPPTQFFERVIEADDDEDIDADVSDFQSILELAKSSGAFRNLGLRWHYRSQHEALIAFSNYRFYEGDLVTYPSAQQDGGNVGVEFFHANGTYRRGGGADNPREAQVVAERVIHHYRTRPGASLGVVTFSVAQADAVIAAVNNLRENHRDLDAHFDKSDRLDGFFVRSLESVQGDERDVIVFSVGYGPDEVGKISTNFGVLNREKGWRRLNVGVTRARQRVEVVASMEAHDIPPTQNENVEALRAYLEFARRGIPSLGGRSISTGLMPESPFEESVLQTVRSWGYVAEPQVGAAGFRIDMAIRHPEKAGLFVLGIECDGYQYHAAPAARDRDRLRDQVLAGLGWRLHRIWGTSWYRDRAVEEERLRNAIEQAIAGKNTGLRRSRSVPSRREVETVPAEPHLEFRWQEPYRKAQRVSLPYWVEPAEPGNHLHLVEPVKQIALAEGPIHMETLSERVREWWGIGRVSARLRDNLDLAIKKSDLLRENDFIDIPDRPVTRVRCKDNVRKPEHIHLDEFALAAELLVADVGGATRDEVLTTLARLFGWARRGSLVEARLNEAIDRVVAAGRLVEVDGKLRTAGQR